MTRPKFEELHFCHVAKYQAITTGTFHVDDLSVAQNTDKGISLADARRSTHIGISTFGEVYLYSFFFGVLFSSKTEA